ncbi:hypothetical protein DFH06DRAFT_1205406 [Mycena polygramma]|nr:hypothetical protein DFH06DRAFT_1205406 [Mycena polygramma]
MPPRVPLRRLFSFPSRKRPKGSTVSTTLDVVRTSLELVKESADVLPPLKAAVGAVVAICNLADRVAASDANAQALAWRAVVIIDTMYNSIDTDKPIPAHLLSIITEFEKLLDEIRSAMERISEESRLHRALHLRRNESQLSKYTARLESAAATFTIGTMAVQTMSLARIEEKVETVTIVATAFESSTVLLLRHQIKFLQLAVVFLA